MINFEFAKNDMIKKQLYNRGIGDPKVLDAFKKIDRHLFIGDDIIDLPVMQKISVPIAVNNAIDSVKSIALYTTKVDGGNGAFREAIDWILITQGRYDDVLQIVKDKIFVNRNK